MSKTSAGYRWTNNHAVTLTRPNVWVSCGPPGLSYPTALPLWSYTG